MIGWLYKITKNADTNEAHAERQYQIHNMSVSSIDCTTSLEKDVINVGEIAEIMVMGIKEREATVKFTYTGISSIFGGKTAGGLKNPDYLPVTNAFRQEFAVVFDGKTEDENTPAGFVFLKGYWKIKQVIKDQDAKEGGLYRLTLVLSYLWDTPQETGIFADDTALINSSDNLQFEIRYMRKNANAYVLAPEIPINVRITKSLTDFNKATFDTITNLVKEDIVLISKQNATVSKPDNYYIFMGIVRETTRGSNGMYKVTCLEISDILYNTMLVGPGSEFDFVYKIPNKNDKQEKIVIKKIIEAITRPYRKPSLKDARWDPGVGVDKTNGLGSEDTIPHTDTDIPNQIFSGQYVGKAVKTFVQDTLGMYLWYNYSTGGKLEYGYIRDTVEINPQNEVWATNTYLEENVNDMVPDCVVVFSADGKDVGTAGNKNTTNVDMYKVTSNVLPQTLEQLAKKIKDDSNIDTSVFRLRFPANTLRFKEGDVFKGLGDQTIARKVMDHRTGTPDKNNAVGETLWQVKDVIITNAYTDIVVGNSHYSVFDQYHNALTKIQDGVPITTHTVATYLSALRSNNTISRLTVLDRLE